MTWGVLRNLNCKRAILVYKLINIFLYNLQFAEPGNGSDDFDVILYLGTRIPCYF